MKIDKLKDGINDIWKKKEEKGRGGGHRGKRERCHYRKLGAEPKTQERGHRVTTR